MSSNNTSQRSQWNLVYKLTRMESDEKLSAYCQKHHGKWLAKNGKEWFAVVVSRVVQGRPRVEEELLKLLRKGEAYLVVSSEDDESLAGLEDKTAIKIKVEAPVKAVAKKVGEPVKAVAKVDGPKSASEVKRVRKPKKLDPAENSDSIARLVVVEAEPQSMGREEVQAEEENRPPSPKINLPYFGEEEIRPVNPPKPPPTVRVALPFPKANAGAIKKALSKLNQ